MIKGQDLENQKPHSPPPMGFKGYPPRVGSAAAVL